jgi:hypothetical protein
VTTVIKAANAHTVVATGWVFPNNAYATSGDNVYATAIAPKNGTTSGDFGFPDFTTGDIPDGSTIDAVRVVSEQNLSASVTGGTYGLQGRVNGVNSGAEATQTATTEGQITATLSGVALSDLRSASTLIKARARSSKGNTNTTMQVNLDFVRTEVDYTPGATPQVGTETATAADASTEAATQVLSEVVAGTDTSTEIAAYQAIESGSAADASAVTIPIVAADAGAAADASIQAAALNPGETGAVADSIANRDTVLADTGAAALNPADLAAGGDTSLQAAAQQRTEAATGTDASSSGASVVPADAGAAADAATIAATLTPADVGAVADAIGPRAFAAADGATGTELSIFVGAGNVDIVRLEDGTGADASSLIATTAAMDAGDIDDVSLSEAAAIAAEASILADSSSEMAVAAAQDSVAGTELAELVAEYLATELALGMDTGTAVLPDYGGSVTIRAVLANTLALAVGPTFGVDVGVTPGDASTSPAAGMTTTGIRAPKVEVGVV